MLKISAGHFGWGLRFYEQLFSLLKQMVLIRTLTVLLSCLLEDILGLGLTLERLH